MHATTSDFLANALEQPAIPVKNETRDPRCMIHDPEMQRVGRECRLSCQGFMLPDRGSSGSGLCLSREPSSTIPVYVSDCSKRLVPLKIEWYICTAYGMMSRLYPSSAWSIVHLGWDQGPKLLLWSLSRLSS